MFGPKETLGLKIFWVQINFGAEKFRITKNFDVKRSLGKKNSGLKKIWITPPQKLNFSIISIITDPILMKL